MNINTLLYKMTTLWLAFGIYILGVAIVLFLRPNLMFRPGSGSWREFGLSSTGSVTVFPFWMFTIVWALVSYALATLGTLFIASTAIQSMPSAAVSENMSNFVPASKMHAPATLPGYYVLDTAASAVGAPKYVYYGTSPPV